MQPNRPSKKIPSPQIIIAISALILFGCGYCFSQSYKTGKTMKTTKSNIKTKKAATVYLDKSDPKFISIKGRAFSDLYEIAKELDPESEKNKSFATWTEKKRNECQALGAESINDYASQTHLGVGIFMTVLDGLGKTDQKKLEKEWDVRIQFLGVNNKYLAEFWEDGMEVSSEANAVAYADELSKSEYAKKHPDSDVGNVEVIKKNYADTRKTIKAGKKERYTKLMALLYTIDNGGAVTFINPFQPSIDFFNKKSK